MTANLKAAARQALAWQLSQPGSVLARDVVGKSIAATGLPEEEIAPFVLDALCASIRSGEIYCSTASADRRNIRIEAETILKSSTVTRQ